jgi:hypothetical protein
MMTEAGFDQRRPEHAAKSEEFDSLFDRIAAAYGGSSLGLHMHTPDLVTAFEALPRPFRRSHSVESKRLMRMFLKGCMPVELLEMLVIRRLHWLLFDMLLW